MMEVSFLESRKTRDETVFGSRPSAVPYAVQRAMIWSVAVMAWNIGKKTDYVNGFLTDLLLTW